MLVSPPKQLPNNLQNVEKTAFLGLKMVKITLLWRPILTKNFNFRGHLSTFQAENTPKSGPFKSKNNAQILLKLHQNNFEKVKKSTFLTPKMVENDHIMGQILTKNLDFRCNLSTFWAENTPKSGPSKAKNNAQTLPKQLQNNFEKVPKTTFLNTKWSKHGCQLWQKRSIFGSIFEI